MNFNYVFYGDEIMGGLKHGELSSRVIGCAMNVHSELGPGLFEPVYQQCLCHELNLNGIKFEREKAMPVVYKDCRLDCGYRIDIMVEGKIIIELKSVERLLDVHKAQLMSYMKLAKVDKRLLINFNVDKYSYVASIDEIKGDGFKLNIIRCLGAFEEEDEIDIPAVQKEIKQLEEELSEVRKKMDGYLEELGIKS